MFFHFSASWKKGNGTRATEKEKLIVFDGLFIFFSLKTEEDVRCSNDSTAFQANSSGEREKMNSQNKAADEILKSNVVSKVNLEPQLHLQQQFATLTEEEL